MMKRALLPGFLAIAIACSTFFIPGNIAHASFEDCTTNANICTGGTQCYNYPGSPGVKRCLLQTQYDVLQAGQSGATNPSNPGATNPANPGATNPADPGATNPGTGQTIANPLKVKDLNSLLDLVLGAVVQLGSIILTIALIWCGFLFVAARGNEEKIRNARTALMWTVIGGLILLGATGIKAVITSTVSGITN